MRGRTIAVALVLGALCAPAVAQEWPSKTVRVIVPFSPGSAVDLVSPCSSSTRSFSGVSLPLRSS